MQSFLVVRNPPFLLLEMGSTAFLEHAAAGIYVGLTSPTMSQAGRIGTDERRLFRHEFDEHVATCPMCDVRLPPEAIARGACEVAGVDPSAFAFRVAGLNDEEREHYWVVAAQAVTLVLAGRLR